MKNNKIAGIITSIVGVSSLIVLLNASTSESIVNWPIEAYLGAVFTIGWLTGVPSWLAYVLGALVFLLMACVCYQLGSGIYRLVVKRR